MLIIYEGRQEVLVAQLENEKELVDSYFFKNSGRDITTYNRRTSTFFSVDAIVEITLTGDN